MVNLNAITHVEIALFKHGRHMMVYYNSTTRYVCSYMLTLSSYNTYGSRVSLARERKRTPRILSKLCRKQQRQLLDNAAAYCDMGLPLLMLSVSR